MKQTLPALQWTPITFSGSLFNHSSCESEKVNNKNDLQSDYSQRVCKIQGLIATAVRCGHRIDIYQLKWTNSSE